MTIRRVRINMFIIVFILICLGMIMIYSASGIYSLENYNDQFYFFKRHLIFTLIGFLLALTLMGIDYNILSRWSRPLLFGAYILLIFVLIPGVGREVFGARRWFRIKLISFQPSEFAALAMVIYIADFIARKEKVIREFLKGFLPPVAVLAGALVLILAQPDLGMSLAIGAVVLIMLYVAGVRLSYLVSLALCGLPFLAALIFAVPYRRARILSFLNPWLDPKGSGFQIIQSQIALGSGGIFGAGLGQSKQKLFYLPAAHTDFIFSIIGEELGILGTLSIVALFGLFIYYGLKIIKNANDKFGFFLALGIVLMISLKALINIGVSSALLPTKGLPLPFISYGGSSLLFDMAGIGLLLNIARTREDFS